MAIIICIGLAILCFALVFMMGSKDMNKLEDYKKTHSELYTKYQEAFDSQPSDFTGVQLCVDNVEPMLLPGEVVIHSYALPRFYNKDGNLWVITDKRIIYNGFKLMKKETKSIPHNKIENIEIKAGTLGTDFEVESKEETIKIYFNNMHKGNLDKFYVYLTDKQLNSQSS